MEVIHIHFNTSQIRKLAKGKTVQLTPAQMVSKQGQLVEIHMLRKHGNEIRRAIKNGKSYRFNPNKIEINGGKFNLPNLSQIKTALTDLIQKPVVQNTIRNPPSISFATDLAKAPKPKPRVPKPTNKPIAATPVLTGGRLPKGSKEAKEKMAKLRSMKKNTKPESINVAKILPAVDINSIPLASTLTPSSKLIKGLGHKAISQPCQLCGADNGAENSTLLKRNTPRIKVGSIIPI